MAPPLVQLLELETCAEIVQLFMVTTALTMLRAPPLQPPLVIVSWLKVTFAADPEIEKQGIPFPSMMKPFPLIVKFAIFEIITVWVRVILAERVIVAPALISFTKSRVFVTNEENAVHETAPTLDEYPTAHSWHVAALTAAENVPTAQLGQ